MSSMKMRGGSSASAAVQSGGKMLGFTNKGTKMWFPGGKKEVHIRLLPAFDDSISESDPNFYKGFLPYRDRQLGNVTGTQGVSGPAFTGWYTYLMGYRMFGRAKEDFISPQTKTMFAGSDQLSLEETSCPVLDCYNVARTDERFKALTVSEGKDFAILTRPKTFAVANALASLEQGDWQNCLCAVPGMGLDVILQSLSWPSIHRVTPRDPNWEDYLLGDVTHPATGLLGKFYQASIGEMSAWSVAFTSRPSLPEGIKVMPVGDEHLEKRKVFDDTTFRFPDYQTLVDYLVYDGALPLELIKMACGPRADISENGPSFTAAVTMPAATTQQSQVAQKEILPPAAKQMVATEAPAQPAPQVAPQPAPQATPVVEVAGSYWVCLDGNVQATPVAFAALEGLAQQHARVQYADVTVEPTNWLNYVKRVQTAPSAPAAPPAPAAPQAPAAPASAEDKMPWSEDAGLDMTPAPASPAAPEQPTVVSEAQAPLTPEELTEYSELLKHFNAGVIEDEQRQRLFNLRARGKRAGQALPN